jgi:hypothetical protein
MLVETTSDWYLGSGSDDDIERDLLERTAPALLEAIEGVSSGDHGYVHFYVYEPRERERLVEALGRHENVAQPVDALRHLLSSEPGADQQMVTELQPIVQQHTALPTAHMGLRNVLAYIDPHPNLPSNNVPKDIPEAPDWEYDRDGMTVDLERTFDQQFFGVFVPAVRDGTFRPIVDDDDFDDEGNPTVSNDAWLTPVPRYGAQLPMEYHHVALRRFDPSPSSGRSRSSLADAAANGLLDGSLDRWRGAVPNRLSISSKQRLSSNERRNTLPDIVHSDIRAGLAFITSELNRLERELSWGVADDHVSKEPLPVDRLGQYRVDHNVGDDTRAVTRNLLATRHIEQQAALDEKRSQYAESTTRDVVLDGEGVPIRVTGFERIRWTTIPGPGDDDIAIPEEMDIRCSVAFHDGDLDLLAPAEVAQRCKLTVDDGVGTNPLVLTIPVETDWSYPNSHRYMVVQPQVTIEELELDDTGRGEALLEWRRRGNPFASSEPFTHPHFNFDTPPSQTDQHPDAAVGAADNEERHAISIGDQFLLVKTADDYIGRKVRTRLENLDPGDDPFIDFLERTLGWRNHLATQLTDALIAAARARGLDPDDVLQRLTALDGDELSSLVADLRDSDPVDGDVVADHLADANSDGDTTSTDDVRSDGGINPEEADDR